MYICTLHENEPMIIFDCQSLRRPNVGYYHYALNLSKALLVESGRRAEKMGLYLPDCARGLYAGLGKFPVRRWHHIDKHYMFLGPRVHLYHVSNQLTQYAPRSFRLPVLTTVHDINCLHFAESQEAYKWLIKHTERAVRHSTRIVTISEVARKDICEYFDLTPADVDMVYNGVDYYDGPITAPEKVPEGEFLLYLGRIDGSKNIHVLPALLDGNDYRLLIVGRPEKTECETPRILEEARRWGCADRIIFTGPGPEPVKHWYLQNCEAFLFPSLAEGFGLPVLEAMRYGKPVFCSDRTSLPEIGGDCAFYFNHDFEPRAMQEELRNGLAAFRAGELPPEKIIARTRLFSWEKAAKEYYDIYEKML